MLALGGGDMTEPETAPHADTTPGRVPGLTYAVIVVTDQPPANIE